MIKQSIIAITTIGLLSITATAANTTACAGCHGANFEKAALGKSKIVKDLSKEDIIKALHGYKDGSYGGAMKGVMKGQVAKLTDKDIEEIATSIAGGGDDKKAEDANKTAETNATVETNATAETNATEADANKTAEAPKK